ncbi:MAG: flagellar protein FlaG [Sulfuritalea sp.]|jgi:flagellar protein FlaG|nr:flagellar protein FlaG [Sulfuritalea sp.]
MNIQSVSSSSFAATAGASQGSAMHTAAPPPLPEATIQPLPGQSGQVQAVPERANVEEAVAKVKVQIQAISSNSLDFSIDENSGKTIVRVTDRESGELIRQIPSQEMLEIARSLDRLQGILVKQKA